MNPNYVELINNQPYLNIQGISKEFKMSVRTAKAKVKQLHQAIDMGHYPKYAIRSSDDMLIVNAYVFLDFLGKVKILNEPNLYKHQTPYDAVAIATLCGHPLI